VILYTDMRFYLYSHLNI